jgi:hypothetical protein
VTHRLSPLCVFLFAVSVSFSICDWMHMNVFAIAHA